jgi:hypothetical protein
MHIQTSNFIISPAPAPETRASHGVAAFEERNTGYVLSINNQEHKSGLENQIHTGTDEVHVGFSAAEFISTKIVNAGT